jgi:hypothetical protein
MRALAWIKEQGYSVPEDVSELVIDFFWLWSLFEFKCLKKNGCAKTIEGWVSIKKTEIPSEEANCFVAYLRDRYLNEGKINAEFSSLNWRKKDRKEFVQGVLEGASPSAPEIYQALLLIVYRFRNNLFHGPKWERLFEGQCENFKRANLLLMETLKW